jgi:hypothetical protein
MAEIPIHELLRSPDQDAVRADLAAFFGRNAERYLASYEKLRAAGPGRVLVSWNWAAFCYNFPWFFCRKMFLLGAIFSLPPLAAHVSVPWAGNAALVISLVFPAFADHWYVRHALSRVAKARALGLEPAERIGHLRRAGGLSLVTGGAAFALYLGLFAMGLLSQLQGLVPGLLLLPR